MAISGEQSDPERDREKRERGLRKRSVMKSKKRGQSWKMSGKIKTEYFVDFSLLGN